MSRLKLSIIILACTLLISGSIIPLCSASSLRVTTELDFILSCNPIQNVPKAHRADAHSTFSASHGPKRLFVGAIRFYQRFISTQDAPACNFVPSCSQFGVESFRNFDFLRAILLTSDRLQRCNSVSTSPYSLDPKSGRFKDPIQTYCELLK
jgi:putative membrane protein insertion efficiency factor